MSIRRVRPATWRGDALAGARAIAPILVGVLPFALIVGVTSVGSGLSPLRAQGLSLVVYAGASQLAAIGLMTQHASLAVIVATIWLINLRFVMYSASLTPYLRQVPARWRLPLSYVLTDQGYAVCIARFGVDAPVVWPAYYLGAALPMWLTWQAGTAVGALVGTTLPDSWGLNFAIPLTFLALLVPQVRDRAGIVAAVVGGAVATATAGLPHNVGLLTGALAGIGAGVAVDRT